MSFTIEYSKERPRGFDNVTYLIYEDGHLIARYWHDFRGEEHGIDFLNGYTDDWPVGQRSDFVQGGGPEPLVLSERAVAYLKDKISEHSAARELASRRKNRARHR
jgi:hypothetical protein